MSYTFLIRHHNVFYKNGYPSSYIEENEVIVEKNKPVGLLFWSAAATSGSGYYYNLKKSESMLETPTAVLARKDCGGLKGCPKELKASVVEFDYDDFDAYGNFTRLHYTYWGNAEVPFMSSPMKSCAVGPFYANGYQLKATQCIAIKDFTSGN